MDADESLGRMHADPLAELARQDLDPFSVTELGVRIAALETEIERVRNHLQRAVSHRASADSLFRQ